MENFEVYVEEKQENYVRLSFEPLQRGYGDTLGNALRRLLLSSIKGAAVTAVKIENVLHEFSTIDGVREDVIEILMNLKHIPIRLKPEAVKDDKEVFRIITIDSDEFPKNFFTRQENPGVITAKDMPWDEVFEFCGDGVLCTLEPEAHLLMEIYVQEGVGYLSAERERPSQPPLPVDALLTDAIFSPVKRVNYQIEPARVGQSIDYEKLILEVWTDGSITPVEAVEEAANIAEDYFEKIAATVSKAPIKPRVREVPKKAAVVEDSSSVENIDDKTFSRAIHDLELSIRSENCLRRGGIETIGQLLQRSHDDLLKIRNLGKKSLTEIEARLTVLGYSLKPSEHAEESEAEKAVKDFTTDKEPKDLLSDIFESTDNILGSSVIDEPEKAEAKEEEIETQPVKPAKKSAKSKTEKTEKKSKSKKSEKAEKAEKTEEPVETVTEEVKEEIPVEPVEFDEPFKTEEAVKAEEQEKPKAEKKSKSKKSEKAKKVEEPVETVAEEVKEEIPVEPVKAEETVEAVEQEKPKAEKKSKSKKSEKAKKVEEPVETVTEEVKEEIPVEPVKAEETVEAVEQEKPKAEKKSKSKKSEKAKKVEEPVETVAEEVKEEIPVEPVKAEDTVEAVEQEKPKAEKKSKSKKSEKVKKAEEAVETVTEEVKEEIPVEPVEFDEPFKAEEQEKPVEAEKPKAKSKSKAKSKKADEVKEDSTEENVKAEEPVKAKAKPKIRVKVKKSDLEDSDSESESE